MSPIQKVPVRGLPPLDTPVAGLAIESRLAQERERKEADHDEKRSDTPARLRASDACSCPRKIAFSSLGVPKDVQYDAAQLMTFRVGDWYHQVTQEALVQWLDCRCEVDFDLRPDFDLYGRCDGVYDDPKVTAVEIKSQAGYGFDLAVGNRRSAEGPGPKGDHLVQVGLAALSPQIQAERVHVIYVSKDRGAVAEWIVGVDEQLPHLENMTVRELVDAEKKRLALVLNDLDAGALPARIVPEFGLVKDPPEAGSRGEPWPCRYCSWQPSCVTQQPERIDGWVDAFKAQA